jgi:hypothetical protein
MMTINGLFYAPTPALGLNHEKLAFRYQGLDQRLAGVEPARVVKEIFRCLRLFLSKSFRQFRFIRC